MNLYRITRTGPHYLKPNVRYGTKRRASAIARQVREANEALERLKQRHPHVQREPTQVTIELAPVTGWTDVTGEWFPAGVGL